MLAALLAACTEPVLNRVAARRMTLREAFRDVQWRDSLLFFRTVLATNICKFPFFEAVNHLTSSWTSLPEVARAVVAGMLYTTAMLPLANYRYMASLNIRVGFGMLYQAYLPTLARDIIYGVARTKVWAFLLAAHPGLPPSLRLWLAVCLACLASAPGNEYRAFVLQPAPKLSPREFFKVGRFLRSSAFASLIPSTALALGQLVVTQVARIDAYEFVSRVGLQAQPWVCVVSLLAVVAGLRTVALGEAASYDRYARPRSLKYLKLQAATAQANISTGALRAAAAAQGGASSLSFGEIASFVMPAFCLVVANTSMSAVDKLFIGRHSSLELAALGPAATAFDSTSFLLTFLNTATLSLIGLARESADPDAVRVVKSHALILAQCAALVLGLGLMLTAAPLCRLLGASPEMLPHSVVYLRVRALGAPIERACSVATTFCLASKDGATPLAVTLVGLSVNVLLDALLCRRFGSAGVAVASVVASLAGFGYLVRRLRLKRRWPSPLAWPRGLQDVAPFSRFAGPVLLAVLFKTLVFADMTIAASSLATASAATHQVFITLFYLSAVAFGNPFSWAAQAFLPPLLAADERQRGAASGAAASTPPALRGLLGSALLAAIVASAVVILMCKNLGSIFSHDPAMLGELAGSSWVLMPFLVSYTIFLTLEGALYSAQRRVAVLGVNFLFAAFSSITMGSLRMSGQLSLRTIWLGSGSACTLATLVAAAITAAALRRGPNSRARALPRPGRKSG